MAIKTLVVDNNPVLVNAVSTLLRQEKCQVRTACNGLEALEILHEYQPDIVFTDLIMPLVGGDKLCKIIRKSRELKDVFIVILSAIILEDDARTLREIDYDACIAKGNIKELREHLQEVLKMFSSKPRESTRVFGDNGKDPGSGPGTVLRELLSEKYHLKAILENLDEGIVELNQQGKIVSLNPAAIEIFHHEMEGMIGIDFSTLSWGDHKEEVFGWLQNDLKKNGGRVLEITESEPLRILENIVSASFIPILDSEPVFAVCILRNITRQYLAEKRKREFDDAVRLVKKMDAMSCMAGGMAHDFNNLLTVICGNLDIIDLAGERAGLDDNLQLLENARKAAYLTVDLARKISCFSPYGIIHRENIVIQDLVSDVTSEFFHDKQREYSCIFGERRNIVTCDSEQIATAITNVLQNAVEAKGTGEIRVFVVEKSFEEPFVLSGQYVPAGDFVGIMIEDHGMGIDTRNLLKIFDPYFSTKQRGSIKGMGLGLTIVYSTLRNHGGHVIVESEYGKGTIVTLYLPLDRSITEKKEDIQVPGLQKKRVLFLENEDQLRIIGKIMLEHLGIQAFTAQNREEALEIVRCGLARSNPLHMVILNLFNLDGNDGVEICRALHEVDPDLKVVVSSGVLLEPAMKNYKEYGFVNLLPKPYTLDDLKRVTAIL
jgi:PAS domain S-box-containing protein